MTLSQELSSQPITLTEAHNLLSEKEKEGNMHSKEALAVMAQTLDYTSRFCRISDKNAIEELSTLLRMKDFTPEEIATIGSVLPQSVEELKIMMPQLNRFSDETLEIVTQKIINLIN